MVLLDSSWISRLAATSKMAILSRYRVAKKRPSGEKIAGRAVPHPNWISFFRSRSQRKTSQRGPPQARYFPSGDQATSELESGTVECSFPVATSQIFGFRPPPDTMYSPLVYGAAGATVRKAPKMHFSGIITRSNDCAVPRHAKTRDRLLGAERGDRLSRRRIPNNDLLIRSPRCQILPIARRGERLDRLPVAPERHRLLHSRNVPYCQYVL
jgi:hypothetical protein